MYGKCDLSFQKSDGKVLTVGTDGLIKFFDINTECYLSENDLKGEISALALDPMDDKNIALGKV